MMYVCVCVCACVCVCVCVCECVRIFFRGNYTLRFRWNRRSQIDGLSLGLGIPGRPPVTPCFHPAFLPAFWDFLNHQVNSSFPFWGLFIRPVLFDYWFHDTFFILRFETTTTHSDGGTICAGSRGLYQLGNLRFVFVLSVLITGRWSRKTRQHIIISWSWKQAVDGISLRQDEREAWFTRQASKQGGSKNIHG
ncbi:hypothetical protein QBC36DRAFT_81948 [Triangularia setosa]|uniref:Secreted protein n=1 Tax=Triangularia setosa TaxID=2587417 RepID=A0AAN7A8G2_9PEZI|nr:hypothetical protein QBC36DRAFT_81948 [Podospora setosa]